VCELNPEASSHASICQSAREGKRKKKNPPRYLRVSLACDSRTLRLVLFCFFRKYKDLPVDAY
jgi:hypothetical protein